MTFPFPKMWEGILKNHYKKKKTNRCLLQILKERLEKHKDTLDLPAFLTRKQSQALRLGGWTIWEA